MIDPQNFPKALAELSSDFQNHLLTRTPNDHWKIAEPDNDSYFNNFPIDEILMGYVSLLSQDFHRFPEGDSIRVAATKYYRETFAYTLVDSVRFVRYLEWKERKRLAHNLTLGDILSNALNRKSGYS